jgi:hypothetical protein
VLLFEAAVSRLSLPTQPYTFGPRVAFVCQFVGAFAVMAWLSANGTDPSEHLSLMVAVLSAQALVVGHFLVCQAEPGRSLRAPVSLLQPGTFQALALVVLTMLAVFPAATVLSRLSPWQCQLSPLAALIPAHALLHVALPVLGTSAISVAPQHRALTIRLVTLAILLAGFLSAAIASHSADSFGNEGLSLLFIPVFALSALPRATGGLDHTLLTDGVLGFWIVTLGFVALAAFVERRRSVAAHKRISPDSSQETAE